MFIQIPSTRSSTLPKRALGAFKALCMSARDSALAIIQIRIIPMGGKPHIRPQIPSALLPVRSAEFVAEAPSRPHPEVLVTHPLGAI